MSNILSRKQYISKADIIEVIKRRRKDWCGNSVEAKYKREECDDILFVINNMRAKEIDLEKELDRYTKSAEYVYNEMRDSYFLVAKHFFELGMQVNNPITAADRGIAEEVITSLKQVENDYYLDQTKEIEWVRNKVKEEEEV